MVRKIMARIIMVRLIMMLMINNKIIMHVIVCLSHWDHDHDHDDWHDCADEDKGYGDHD